MATDPGYQAFLRQRDGAARAGAPFSVPPEAPGAPLGAPMPMPGPATAGTAAPTVPSPQAPPPATASADATPARPAAAAPQNPDWPSFGVPTNLTSEVPLVRVDTVPGAAVNGPNVIAYALRTTHPVGTQRYTRRNPLRWQVWERNCLQFGDQNAAQEAFLAAGGPENDRGNLDPDGDGYACWWNPEPIRRAMRAAAE
ncbi:MAG: hypothetical protein ACXIVG_13450 [Pararhodobacter sp.]